MRPRYPFLDGVRGLAALYVVLFHGYLVVRWQCAPLPPALAQATLPFQFGRSAVGVFIVLSGFVLSLPALGDGGRLDVARFARKRAWRILPPYYAATLLGLAVCAGPAVESTKSWASILLPAFRADTLLAHLFLVHNLRHDLAYNINISVWSLATEMQIYALFALVLLPLWRRFGLGVTVAAAWALGLGSVAAFPEIRIGAPWYLGLFSFGMAAAQVRLRPETLPKLASVPWRPVAALLWGLFFVGVVPVQFSGFDSQGGISEETVFFDILVGLAAMASILAGCEGAKALEGRVLQRLATISFSLYLTHAPLLGFLGWVCWRLGLGAWPTLLALYGVGVPGCLAFAALFYRVIEAPSLRAAARSGGSRSVPDMRERASTAPIEPAGAGH